jgi:hypothetical protein
LGPLSGCASGERCALRDAAIAPGALEKVAGELICALTSTKETGLCQRPEPRVDAVPEGLDAIDLFGKEPAVLILRIRGAQIDKLLFYAAAAINFGLDLGKRAAFIGYSYAHADLVGARGHEGHEIGPGCAGKNAALLAISWRRS